MALKDTMESTGLKLFKYRGQIPVLIFILAVPILFLSMFWPPQPVRIACVVVSAISAVAGLALRAYTVSTTPKGTSGRNTKSQVADSLNTKGIYSIVRHPLYLANYLIWAGILIYTTNPLAFIIVSLAYWIYYERIMLAEEGFLRQKYGQQFEEWAKKVPAFLPKFPIYENGGLEFSWKTFIRREYATILSTLVAFLSVDIINSFIYHNFIITCGSFSWRTLLARPLIWITLTYIVIALIIKLIKHKTKLLDAEANRD